MPMGQSCRVVTTCGLMVVDRHGVMRMSQRFLPRYGSCLARIDALLLARGRSPGEAVPVVLVDDEDAGQAPMRAALA